jgi:hypothetical protein
VVTDRLTAHRQTDQRALVEIIQRPSVRAGSPVENLSVRPSVRPTVRAGSAGGLKRGTVASDGRTHARTHQVNLYIRLGQVVPMTF